MKEELYTRLRKLNNRIRRPAGLLIVLLVLGFGDPKRHLFILVLPLIIIGLFIRIWAAGVLHKNRTVTRTGPYAYVRNPLYLGSFLLGIGFCFLTHKLWIVLLGLIIFLVVYGFTIYSEERELSNMFGDDYREYKKLVPSLIPFFKLPLKNKNVEKGTFSFKHAFIVNKEYNAILGTLALLFIMYLKYKF